MRKRDACLIEAPDWLNLDDLQQRVKEERQNPDTFSALPFHYLQMAQNILEVTTKQDMPDQAQVKTVLQELKEERQRKARLGLGVLNAQVMKARHEMCDIYWLCVYMWW